MQLGETLPNGQVSISDPKELVQYLAFMAKAAGLKCGLSYENDTNVVHLTDVTTQTHFKIKVTKK